ncbi:U3 small nucleolar RNA-associated protein 15-like protein [Frankliniella fusca]|uniref:U3 small nucleolar RNA-associated protein 15 homolog n=1 Tax=Frankliniella fusca TaxID=407009 RepID=A0AAE1LRR5_9NEOP|nr:U3 small nucleolar RNA-associated protein 15-like protein [Frankliniella fusca]
MSAFKKTNVKVYSKNEQKLTPDNIYWKQLGVPVLLKEFGPVDYINFSPIEPYHFAVTCSVRVQVYNPITKTVWKNLSRFREAAYGGSFRSDGRLLCAGGEESIIRMFDVSSKTPLRIFKGHSAAVHRCFFTPDNTHISSFSDDKTVRIWDIPSEKELSIFSDHQDYVRAGAVCPSSPDVVLSGSYDRSVRLYDTRTNAPVLNVDHGSPVESVLFLPSGGIFLSAGGTEIKVWDAIAGGRLLAKISQHHKTVTCLALASGSKRLLSSSLDRHVKIYDVSTYQVVHTLDYPNAILSVAASADDETVVAGMVDGLVSVSRRETKEIPSKRERHKVSYRYVSDQREFPAADVVVREAKANTMSKSDTFLCKFQYSKALDSVLLPYVVNKNPHVTVSVLEELMRRKGLRTALAGRDAKALLAILRFLVKYIGDYRYTRTVTDVSNVLLDIYGDSWDKFRPDVCQMLQRLAARANSEVALTQDLTSLEGMMEILLAGSSVVSSSSERSEGAKSTQSTPTWQASETAQKTFIVNVF